MPSENDFPIYPGSASASGELATQRDREADNAWEEHRRTGEFVSQEAMEA
jgi:hypothetical protein